MTGPPITLLVGDRDISGSHDGLTFSNVDPGGYELLSCNPQLLRGVRPGAPVIARCGLQTAFWGRLNEPGQHQRGSRSSYTVAAFGAGDVLKRETMREIYVNRDLAVWGGSTIARRKQMISSSYMVSDCGVATDPNSTGPALRAAMAPPWQSTAKPMAEAWYDAQGIELASIYYEYEASTRVNFADAAWNAIVSLANDDTRILFNATADLSAGAITGSGTLLASAVGRVWAQLQFYYDAASGAGGDGVDFEWFWRNLAVYGNHGLTKRGSAPEGFYPDDIAWNAVARCGGIGRGAVEQASAYIVPHSVYLDPTPYEQVVDDQASLMGWHWGVWEPTHLFSEVPLFHFRAPPTDAAVVVSLRDCEDVDVPKIRLDALYDTAKVGYTDAAGSSRVVTVTAVNPLLQEAGIDGQTLTLNLGLGSAAAATLLGQNALALAASAARGGGSAIVPGMIRQAVGGYIPACLLRSGIDRIRLLDLPDAGPVAAVDSRRYDTFRIKRVETTVQNGVPSTRIEFDSGADLLEVLQARLALGLMAPFSSAFPARPGRR